MDGAQCESDFLVFRVKAAGEPDHVPVILPDMTFCFELRIANTGGFVFNNLSKEVSGVQTFFLSKKSMSTSLTSLPKGKGYSS